MFNCLAELLLKVRQRKKWTKVYTEREAETEKQTDKEMETETETDTETDIIHILNVYRICKVRSPSFKI